MSFESDSKEFMHSPLSSPEALAGGDCCGNGEGHTRDGTPIDIFDRVGIKVEEKVPGMLFEAAWGPDGAVCIGHVRIPELGPLEDLVASCPRLKSVALGGACQETAPGIVIGFSWAAIIQSIRIRITKIVEAAIPQ